MTAQELATAVRYRLRVIALVHNDSTYGAIKNIQKRAHEGRYLDVELNNPDFLQLAAAYGVPGSRVRGPEELRAAVARCPRSRRAVADRGSRRVAIPARSGDAGEVIGRQEAAPTGSPCRRDVAGEARYGLCTHEPYLATGGGASLV